MAIVLEYTAGRPIAVQFGYHASHFILTCRFNEYRLFLLLLSQLIIRPSRLHDIIWKMMYLFTLLIYALEVFLQVSL